MGLKYLAYWCTGSVALYSDALESIVNLITALVALYAIHVSAQPADRRHQFGHHKAEYFSAVLEGVLIVVAALLIFREAYDAFITAARAQRAAAGHRSSTALATAINAGWSYFLLPGAAGSARRRWSADGWHLLTDVATSIGVLVGLALATLTGWQVLDPALAAPRRAQHPVGRLAAGARVGERPDGRGRDRRGGAADPAGDLRQCRGRHRGARRQDAHRRPRHLHRVPPGRAGQHDGRRLASHLRPHRGGAAGGRAAAPRC